MKIIWDSKLHVLKVMKHMNKLKIKKIYKEGKKLNN